MHAAMLQKEKNLRKMVWEKTLLHQLLFQYVKLKHSKTNSTTTI